MLKYAVDEANEIILKDTGMELDVEIDTIAYGQEYMVSKLVCNLLEVCKYFHILHVYCDNCPSFEGNTKFHTA